MTNNQARPLFNLKAVINETGIKADTLRAWERRYGIPSPRRTPSGHRLYSQDDIDLLRWLVARQAEGMSISRAAELWHNLEAERGRDGMPTAKAASAPPSAHGLAPLQRVSAAGDNSLRALRSQWTDACLRFAEADAEQVLGNAFALFTPEIVCLEVIQKGLATLGAGWYQGRVTVQQEHFASALALRRIEALLVAAPPPTRSGPILIGCPPEEEHTFVPLLLSLLLRRRGWPTIYLGANVPLASLDETVAATRPQLVVLTAQQLATARGLYDMSQLLLQQRVPLAYGGQVFNRMRELQEVIPGRHLGESMETGLATIEEIMLAPRVVHAQRTPSPAHAEALASFRTARPQIEAVVAQRYLTHALTPQLLTAANHHFGRNLEAALALGKIDFAGADLAWIEGLLVNHAGLAADRVRDYVIAYLYAVRSVLEDRAALLTDWLVRLLATASMRPAMHEKTRPAAQLNGSGIVDVTPAA